MFSDDETSAGRKPVRNPYTPADLKLDSQGFVLKRRNGSPVATRDHRFDPGRLSPPPGHRWERADGLAAYSVASIWRSVWDGPPEHAPPTGALLIPAKTPAGSWIGCPTCGRSEPEAMRDVRARNSFAMTPKRAALEAVIDTVKVAIAEGAKMDEVRRAVFEGYGLEDIQALWADEDRSAG